MPAGAAAYLLLHAVAALFVLFAGSKVARAEGPAGPRSNVRMPAAETLEAGTVEFALWSGGFLDEGSGGFSLDSIWAGMGAFDWLQFFFSAGYQDKDDPESRPGLGQRMDLGFRFNILKESAHSPAVAFDALVAGYDGGPDLRGLFVLQKTFLGRLRCSVAAGYRGATGHLADLRRSIVAGLGASLYLSDSWRLAGEFQVKLPRSEGYSDGRWLFGGLAAVSLGPNAELALTVEGGVGTGVPDARILLGLVFSTSTEFSRDSDSDGIPDTSDDCPFRPEDSDGFEDSDGCPEKGPNVEHKGVKNRFEYPTPRFKLVSPVRELFVPGLPGGETGD
ncbi:MAG: hypothetical protein D6806_06475 [Deltaproteobacteria bacterium]|nr:MAG: hypothetical protein D6806_06475 [Deltaproteobacteria bacterium]